MSDLRNNWLELVNERREIERLLIGATGLRYLSLLQARQAIASLELDAWTKLTQAEWSAIARESVN